MRHAEKRGDLMDPHLSDEGVVRAKRLATYIPEMFGQVDFLFAAAEPKHSLRPIETIQPLSEAIDVPIDDSYADQDYGALAEELLSNDQYSGKNVLICWHHGNIPSLANALKAASGSYPDPWDRNVFNEILQSVYGPTDIPTLQRHIEPF